METLEEDTKATASERQNQAGIFSSLFGLFKKVEYSGQFVNSQYGIAKRNLKCFELCNEKCEKDKDIEAFDKNIKILEKKGGFENTIAHLKKVKDALIKACKERNEALREALKCDCDATIDLEEQQRAAKEWSDYGKSMKSNPIHDIPDLSNSDSEIIKPSSSKCSLLRNAKDIFTTSIVKMNLLIKRQ